MSPQPLSSSRDRLLKAAKHLFAAHGYEQTATSAIARQAGTSESQLMRYFGGKIGLLEAVFDAAWLDLTDKARRIVERRGPSRQAILDLLDVFISALARDPDLATLLLFEARRLRGDHPRVRLAKGFVGLGDTLKELIRAGQASREIQRSLDPAALSSAIIGATEALIRDRMLARSAGSRSFSEKEIEKTLGVLIDAFVSSRPTRRRSR